MDLPMDFEPEVLELFESSTWIVIGDGRRALF
jgi:hypothetical protein